MRYPSLSMEITRRCPLKCRHCCVSASPERNEVLSEKTLDKIADWLSDNKVGSIGFTGGEPFLELCRINGFLDKIDLKKCCPTRKVKIITSCSIDIDKIKSMSEKFERFTHISFSFDKYHLEFVPIERYVEYYKYFTNLGKKVSLSICYNGPKELAETYELVPKIMKKDTQIDYQPITYAGRADTINSERIISDKMPSSYKCRNSNTILVCSNGRVSFCCLEFPWFHFGRFSSKNVDNMLNSPKRLMLLNHKFCSLVKKHNIKGSFDISSRCNACMDLMAKINNKSL